MGSLFAFTHLNVPDALHARRIDVRVVGGGDAAGRLANAAAAPAHHPLEPWRAEAAVDIAF